MSRLALALVLLAAPAQAALSGFYDSATKIAAILQSAALADALHQAPVAGVEQVAVLPDGDEVWRVTTQACDMRVILHPEPPPAGMVGATTYAVTVGKGCE